MNKCFVKVFATTFCILLSLSLFFSFSVFADVNVPDVNILVRASASTSSYDFPFVSIPENSFIEVADAGSTQLSKGSVRFSFVSDSFLSGVEYTFHFVIASPNAPISVSSGSVAGSFIPSSGSPVDLIWGQDINFSLVDTSTYPDPFTYSGSFDYSSEAYYISGSFIPNDDSGVMTVDINFSPNTYIFYSGYAYMSFSASDDAYNQGLFIHILDELNNIYNAIVNGVASINSTIYSMSTVVTNGFSQVNHNLAEIGQAIDALIGIVSDNPSFDDSLVEDLDKNNQDLIDKSEQIDQDLEDLKNAQDSFADQSQADSESINNFLSGHIPNPSGIIGNISSTVNSLSAGIEWVSGFFALALNFQPLYMILFVASFMHILSLLLNVSYYASYRFGRRSRSDEIREQHLSESRERREAYASRYDQSRRMRSHYGFTD